MAGQPYRTIVVVMTDNRFPGRWLGGCALILGPLLMLTGVLLRAGHHFFFPDQLAAYDRHPALIFTAYSAFVVGNVLLWPAVAALAQRIGVTRPGWALCGGALAIFGLFQRTFHAGVDHLAFQLVRVQGVEVATRTVGDAYGAYYVLSALSVAIMAGWVVLAIGAWRARVLGPFRAIALAAMSALPLGVLKGTTPLSVIAVLGLAAALVPLGVRVLRDGPAPSAGAVVRWAVLVPTALGAMALLGTAG
ncbi:hypothetical protein GCM10027280_39730 [Micromonospora polyrhachis]